VGEKINTFLCDKAINFRRQTGPGEVQAKSKNTGGGTKNGRDGGGEGVKDRPIVSRGSNWARSGHKWILKLGVGAKGKTKKKKEDVKGEEGGGPRLGHMLIGRKSPKP